MEKASLIRENINQKWNLITQSTDQGKTFTHSGISAFKTGLPTPFFNVVSQFHPHTKQEIREYLAHINVFFENGISAPYYILQETSNLDKDIQDAMITKKFVAFGTVKGMHRKLTNKLHVIDPPTEAKIYTAGNINELKFGRNL